MNRIVNGAKVKFDAEKDAGLMNDEKCLSNQFSAFFFVSFVFICIIPCHLCQTSWMTNKGWASKFVSRKIGQLSHDQLS